MNTRQLLHLAEYGAYRALFGIVTRLPQSALRRWGSGVGLLAFAVLGRRRRLTLDNLSRAFPERDAAELRRLARDCFASQGALYHEQVWAMGRSDQVVEHFEIVGREHLERAHARGKGLFVLTGHYGCWEIAGYPLGRLLGKLHIVARPQNNPFIAAHFERLRERNGNVQIDRGRAGTRILKVLKKGGAVGIAIDHRVRPEQAILVPFLGRLAWTSRLPAYLSTVTGCAVVPMVCVPLPDGRYRMTLDPPILPEGEGDDEIERLTRLYSAALEPYVRARPELWLWMHSRWRRTARHRRPEVVDRLVKEAGLPAALALDQAAQHAGPGSPVRALERLVGGAFLEHCRHLLLVVDGTAADRRESDTGQGAAVSAAPSRRPRRQRSTPSGSRAAASLGHAFARLGYPTRYFELGDLLDQLERAQEANRLDSALRELDPVPALVVDRADPRPLSPARLELLARFLVHRRERGSVVVAGAGVAAWRQAAGAAQGEALLGFVDACEIVDLSSMAPEAFTVPDSSEPRADPATESEAGAPAL